MPWFLLRQAFFGHDMLKPTQLRGTLPGLVKMRRVMTKEARAKYEARFAERSDLSCKMDSGSETSLCSCVSSICTRMLKLMVSFDPSP